MKKVIKKRKNTKRIMKTNHKLLVFVIFALYLTSSIIMKNHNIGLDHQLQTIQIENKNLKDSNQTLRIKIYELSSFERMSNIADKQGLENREGIIQNVR